MKDLVELESRCVENSEYRSTEILNSTYIYSIMFHARCTILSVRVLSGNKQEWKYRYIA